MKDTEKEVEKNINNDEKTNDINENKEDNKQDEKVNKNTEDNKTHPKTIGTIGSFFLTAILILILGTGALVYYLVNNARQDLENNADQIVNSIIEEKEKEQEEVKPIANIIDTAITEVTTQNTTIANNVDASSIKLLNEDLIVLYNGLILPVDKMEVKELKYIDNTSDKKDDYVITYYNYENYAFKDSKLGTLSSQVFDGVVKVENVGKIAISENYQAIPREIKVVNALPTVVVDSNPKISEYDSTKVIIADLDGNNTEEYILILANKTTGYSKITLADSKGNKVADLAYIEKSKWDAATKEEYYLSISNLQVIDIDNDGIMEILIELPTSENIATKISTLKYKNGELQGTTDIECSLVATN